jgi:hypothetical protein
MAEFFGLMLYNGMPQGCCLAALGRFGWSNLGLDAIFLKRQSLVQEAASSTLKVKKEEKYEREREKLKQLLRKRKSAMDWTNILHNHCFIYFVGVCLRGVVVYHCPYCSCPKPASRKWWRETVVGGSS